MNEATDPNKQNKSILVLLLTSLTPYHHFYIHFLKIFQKIIDIIGFPIRLTREIVFFAMRLFFITLLITTCLLALFAAKLIQLIKFTFSLEQFERN